MEYIAYGPPDLEANVTALNTTETQVLRCNTLDSVCFTSVLGKRVPNYLLSTCSQRALLLSPKLPKYTYIFGASAWWVHTGENPPQRLQVCANLVRSSWRSVDMVRRQLPASQYVQIAGVPCICLEHAALEMALHAGRAQGPEVILTACRHGANRSRLLTAFNYLRGRSRNGWLEQLINELLPAVISTRTLGTGSTAGRIDTVNLAHDR